MGPFTNDVILRGGGGFQKVTPNEGGREGVWHLGKKHVIQIK